MKPLISHIALITLAACLPAMAGTVAYWRFEEGTAGANMDRGGNGNGVYHAAAWDSSGNGNHLSTWSDGGCCGYIYSSDVAGPVVLTGATNTLSVVNSESYPAMFTEPGGAMQSWEPKQWTIEIAFQPENGGHRTLVGRDSRGAATSNGALSALYLQLVPGNGAAIKFCDVNGYWHEAVSAPGVVTGFNHPDSINGVWHALAAVSDGDTLSLYLKVLEGDVTDYQLIAQTDLTASGSPDTTLTKGQGSGGDWEAGIWSVGRGLYNGDHGDRAYGFIDEVRISDVALSPSQFLWVPEPSTALLALPAALAGLLRRRRQ